MSCPERALRSGDAGMPRFVPVSVAGSPDAPPGDAAFAFELGGLLARAGFSVVCGGGGGVMEAVCRGAVEAGGTTVGILPGSDPAEANRFVKIAIPTGIGSARNRIVALAGIALVAVGGRYGTLSEVAFALDAGRPVCAFGSWASVPGVTEAGTPEEAVRFVMSRQGGRPC